MCPSVVSYLQKYGLDNLVSTYKVLAKRHLTYPNLVLLKYDQLNSNMGERIVQECRGIILDESDNWSVISYGYNKFFNYQEGAAAKIDWSTSRVYEKLDGSLMTLYYYDNMWHVSSSGRPDASGEVMNTNLTFKDLFWDVWNKLGYKLPNNTDTSFMFEMMTPLNRVVVRHESSNIVLHGARRLSDFVELDPLAVASNNGWRCVKTFNLNSMDAIVESAKNLDPMESEGYVVCDANFNRVKMKTPQYVAVAHLKDGFSTRRMLEIVRSNENNEFLSYFPEYELLYQEISNKYNSLLNDMQVFYNKISHIADQKLFAAEALKSRFSGALFSMRSGKVSNFKTTLAEMNIRDLETLLGIKCVDITNAITIGE